MKGKDVARVLFRALYFALLFQATHCRLRFSNSFFCCQKLSANSKNFSCWNNTLEQGSFETASQTIDNCTQNHYNLCFNVTSITESCPNDISSGSVDVGAKKRIQIGAFVPFLQSDKYGYAAAMKMAIDFINNRSDILQNYTLVLDSEDTKWVCMKLFLNTNYLFININCFQIFIRVQLIFQSYPWHFEVNFGFTN